MIGSICYDQDGKQALIYFIFTRMLQETVKIQGYPNALCFNFNFSFLKSCRLGPGHVFSFITVDGGAVSL